MQNQQQPPIQFSFNEVYTEACRQIGDLSVRFTLYQQRAWIPTFDPEEPTNNEEPADKPA